MSLRSRAVVGIDVGGEKKGFHAVVPREGTFETYTSTDPGNILAFCRDLNVTIVAVDAPCGWSNSGRSRLAERELKLLGKKIRCFSTPTRAVAEKNDFYNWVLNGETLYQRLASDYPLFDGEGNNGPVCFETFPHAVVCALNGKVVSAKRKASTRRNKLRDRGYDVGPLRNIDFVDAALCAVAAESFRQGRIHHFGGRDEGFIVVPALDVGD